MKLEMKNIVIAGRHCSCTGLQHLALPQTPHSALEITLSNEEAITLAPESTALARVVKAEVIVGASNVGENVIYERGQHANFGRRDKGKGLTIFDVLGT